MNNERYVFRKHLARFEEEEIRLKNETRNGII